MFPPNNNKEFKEQMIEARRLQILMGAAQIFSEKGFHKATTRQIAKAAGVSEGTIYNYFDNKRDLLLAMLELIGGQTLKTVVQDHAEDDPKSFLIAVLQDRYQLLHERGQFMAPIVAEIFADTELREAVYQKVAMPVIGYVEKYLQTQVAAGKFRIVNPIVMSRALIGAMILNSILKVTNLDPRYEDIAPETMIEEIVSLLVDGVLAAEA